MDDRSVQLIQGCVCICNKCNNYMALYKDLIKKKYYVECDVCPNFRYVEVEDERNRT